MQPLPVPADDRELREVREREVTARKWLASSGGQGAIDKEAGPKAPKAARTQEVRDEDDTEKPSADIRSPVMSVPTDQRVLRSASRKGKWFAGHLSSFRSSVRNCINHNHKVKQIYTKHGEILLIFFVSQFALE